jgi:hypothetical protein
MTSDSPVHGENNDPEFSGLPSLSFVDMTLADTLANETCGFDFTYVSV